MSYRYNVGISDEMYVALGGELDKPHGKTHAIRGRECIEWALSKGFQPKFESRKKNSCEVATLSPDGKLNYAGKKWIESE